MARKSRKQFNTADTIGLEPVQGSVTIASADTNDHAENETPDKKADTVMKAGIYARLSVEDDVTRDSIDNQVMLIRNFINARDDLIYEESYIDNGYTGTNFNRPAFNEMMSDLRKGRIQCVVVKDLSRFGRNYHKNNHRINSYQNLLILKLLNIHCDLILFLLILYYFHLWKYCYYYKEVLILLRYLYYFLI